MNWRVLAQQLANDLQRRGIDDPRVLEQMAHIPRDWFVPDELRAQAYDDCALPIASGQTISQPYIVALMTSAAELTPDARVLEVGTGSGYQAAVLSGLCREVITLERLPELAESARLVWQELGISNITSIVCDGTIGWPPLAPYDAILVTAGSPEIPTALKHQLAVGGRLVIPVGSTEQQELLLCRRTPQGWQRESLCGCRFVKLLGAAGWQEND